MKHESVGNWLWSRLMDYCQSRGIAPATCNDLFAIVGQAREAFDQRPEPIEANTSGEPVTGLPFSDAEINEITLAALGKWPSFEAQSWACKVVNAVEAEKVLETLPHLKAANAIDNCDWSGAPIGNKAVLGQATNLLRSGPLGGRIFLELHATDGNTSRMVAFLNHGQLVASPAKWAREQSDAPTASVHLAHFDEMGELNQCEISGDLWRELESEGHLDAALTEVLQGEDLQWALHEYSRLLMNPMRQTPCQ